MQFIKVQISHQNVFETSYCLHVCMF